MPDPKDDPLSDAVTTPLTGEARVGDPRTGASGEGNANAERSPAGAEPRIDAAVARALAQRYDILSELGRGGMGAVYRARDRETGDTVALKVLLPQIAADPEIISRFKSELLLARRVTHPNVCRVHELLRLGEVSAISMEYVEGESLRALLRRRQGIALREGLRIAREIIAGLAAAHAQGVVHRDLKPENILIARDGAVKVMDFGIARSLEGGATVVGNIIGTPAYMSPEQAEGMPADHRSDVYSLGLVLFEIFTGRPAFTGETGFALAMKHVHEMPPAARELEAHLPGFLDRAIAKCLEKKPAKRFATVTELEEALTESAAPAEAAPGARIEDLPLPAHLAGAQRADAWLFGGALLALAAFLGLFDTAYPYSALAVGLTKQKAESLAKDAAQKLGTSAPVTSVRVFFGSILDFEADVLVHGTAEAIRRQQGLGIYVNLDAPGRSANVYLDRRGAVVAIGTNTKEERTVEKNWITKEKLLERAIVLVREIVGRDVSRLTPERVEVGRVGTVMWLMPPGEGGGVERLGVMLRANGSQWMNRMVYYPGNRGGDALAYQAAREKLHGRVKCSLRLRLWTWLALPGVFIALFFVRRLSHHTESSALFSAAWGVAAMSAMAFSVREPGFLEYAWFTLPAGAVTGVVFFYVIFSVCEYYLERTLPERAVTWRLALRRPFRSRSVGLAMLRGCAAGAVFAGIYTVLIRVFGGFELAAHTLIAPLLFVETWATATAILAFTILATLILGWGLVAFPGALAARASRRPAVFLAVPAAMWLAMSAVVPGAVALPLVPLLLSGVWQGAFFAGVLYRYDLLTVLMALFTALTALVLYPAYVTLSGFEFWPYFSLLLPWLAQALLGAAIFFVPQLSAAGNRVRALFE